MYKLLYILIALPLLAGPALSNSYTWIAPPGRGQLAQDPTLIPKGKGLLFVPTMTGALNEPSFLILQGKKRVREANPGTGVLLSPGYYEVLIGSGTDAQMTSRTVPIRENTTTLLKPFWSGLVINVIDEQRNSLDESYELYWEDKQENYGIGFGVEEERGEAVKTWLLPPGVYSVVPVGENISTTRKFSVRLAPGELVQRNLVVNSSDNFVGFYPPSPQGLLGQKIGSNWKTTLQLSGSTRLSTSQNATGEDRSVLSLDTEIFGRSIYNTDRNFFNLRLTFEEDFILREGDTFRNSEDEFEIRATYIYRLSKRLGPYLRGVFNTKLFATEVLFDPPRDLLIFNAAGQMTGKTDVEEFTLSPAFSPLELRQGIGINSQVVRSFPFTLDMRVGFGARQKYFTNTFDLKSTHAVALKDEATTGLEALLILNLRPAQSVILDSEFDIIIPGRAAEDWEFTWENRLRLAFNRFVNMDVVFDFEREKATRRLQSQQQVLLRFAYLL